MIEVDKLTPKEWAEMSQDAHKVAFEEVRKPDMDRVSFALLGRENHIPLGYVTVRELDKESIYWQYGGAFPSSAKSPKVLTCYLKFINYCLELGYRRITTYIENTNKSMLKLAIEVGFLPIGIRTFKNQILLELILEGEK